MRVLNVDWERSEDMTQNLLYCTPIMSTSEKRPLLASRIAEFESRKRHKVTIPHNRKVCPHCKQNLAITNGIKSCSAELMVPGLQREITLCSCGENRLFFFFHVYEKSILIMIQDGLQSLIHPPITQIVYLGKPGLSSASLYAMQQAIY